MPGIVSVRREGREQHLGWFLHLTTRFWDVLLSLTTRLTPSAVRSCVRLNIFFREAKSGVKASLQIPLLRQSASNLQGRASVDPGTLGLEAVTQIGPTGSCIGYRRE